MTAHTRFNRPCGVGLLLACLLLTACTPDTEDGFRDEVGQWLSLGDTLYFNATRSCTAGVFEARSGVFGSQMRSVSSWPEAVRLIEQRRPVVFENATGSPSELTGAIMGQTPHLGTQFLSAGLAGRACMTAEVQAAYHAALSDSEAALMFDPESQTIGVLQIDSKRVFVARGEL